MQLQGLLDLLFQNYLETLKMNSEMLKLKSKLDKAVNEKKTFKEQFILLEKKLKELRQNVDRSIAAQDEVKYGSSMKLNYLKGLKGC